MKITERQHRQLLHHMRSEQGHTFQPVPNNDAGQVADHNFHPCCMQGQVRGPLPESSLANIETIGQTGMCNQHAKVSSGTLISDVHRIMICSRIAAQRVAGTCAYSQSVTCKLDHKQINVDVK